MRNDRRTRRRRDRGQPRIPGGAFSATAGGFLDQQSGIGGGPGGNRRCAAGSRPALLPDQLQQRRLARTLRRSRFLRALRRRVVVRQYRITQRLQFRIADAIDFHPKPENGHGQQLRALPVTAVDENRPALLEGCENRLQSLFRASHQRFFRYRACEAKWRRSIPSFHIPLHKVRIFSKRRDGLGRPGCRRGRDWPRRRKDR
jgi:hypothetical protein